MKIGLEYTKKSKEHTHYNSRSNIEFYIVNRNKIQVIKKQYLNQKNYL
jgi:hypothetical protein